MDHVLGWLNADADFMRTTLALHFMHAVFGSRTIMISGGPGTGKTFTTAANEIFLLLAVKEYTCLWTSCLDAALASAAKEICNIIPAGTPLRAGIHRFIGAKYKNGTQHMDPSEIDVVSDATSTANSPIDFGAVRLALANPHVVYNDMAK